MFLPEPGTTGKFNFVSKFSALDGFYKTISTTSYETALSDGVDFVASLYTPANISDPAVAYAADASEYAGVRVVKIVSVDQDTVRELYVPEPVIATQPDVDVIKVLPVNIGLNLGLFKDPTAITWVISKLNDIVANEIGVENTAVLFTNPKKAQWMTEQDYQVLESGRAAVKGELTSPQATITALRAELQKAQDRNQALSAIIYNGAN